MLLYVLLMPMRAKVLLFGFYFLFILWAISVILMILIFRNIKAPAFQPASAQPTTPHADVKRFCGNCGASVAESIKYCPSCGSKM